MKGLYARVFQQLVRMISPFLPWRLPELLQGEGSVLHLPERLKREGIKHVFIVTDRGIVELGLMDPLLSKINEVGINYTIFDETVANPTIENVEKARDLYLEAECEAFIAFGGGSPIDCAKAVAARLVRPNKTVSQLKGLFKVRKPLPYFCAVPTTSGTGSEGTLAAVISNPITHEKYALTDHALIPHLTVLDPKLTLKLPKDITAMTGMDALTHAVEAYIGQSTTAETRRYAKEAVKLIFDYLPQAYEKGDDLKARQQMQEAAYLAGLAFTRSYVGYIHAIAHTLSGFYNLPHGLANAVIMPHVLKFYGPSVYRPLSELADLIDLKQGEREQVRAEAFIQAIEEMNRHFNLPTHLAVIRNEDIGLMTERAQAETIPLYPVPKILKNKELMQVYHMVKGDESI